jgi:hypothetical protein
MVAWRSLVQNQVLYRDDSPVRDTAPLDPLLDRLGAYRSSLIALSAIVGLGLTFIDANCLLREYRVLAHEICGAPDFAVAFRLHENFPTLAADQSTLFYFVAAQYFMQALLIAMAFTVLFQLLLHSVAFLAFEQLEIPAQGGLSLRLNPRDAFNEFGLMNVNEAINLTYVFIAVAMIIPVLSVANKVGADVGRSLMASLLPILLFAPAIIPVFDRIARRRRTAEQVRAADDPDLTRSFLQQRLWPFEQTALSYVGKICLAAAIASWIYVVTGELKGLFKIVGG